MLKNKKKLNEIVIEESPYSKYNLNLYETMIELAIKANNITETLQTVQQSINDFDKIVENVIIKYPENENIFSFQELLKSTINMNQQIKSQLQLLSENYRNIGKNLKEPWEWKEKLCETDKLRKQQMKEIFDIHCYRQITKYIEDMRSNQNINISENKIETFKINGERIIEERKKLMENKYEKPVREIIMNEHKDKSKLPIYFEKMMYKLYYDKGEIEGIFRQCAGVDEMNEYFDLIGIADFDLMDYILISAMLKKYLREGPDPIWPQELYENLIDITTKYSQNSQQWCIHFQFLYMKVPEENRTFIEYFIALCLKIIDNPTSKMTLQNLSICIAPGFFRKLTNDNVSHSSHQVIFTAFVNLMKFADDIFIDIDKRFDSTKYNLIMKSELTSYTETFHERRLKFDENTQSKFGTRIHKRRKQSQNIIPKTNHLTFKDLCNK